MRCDAIVVGGGLVGLSAGWFLKQAGLADVIVLERKLLASGGSGLGTGSVHTQRWYGTDSQLIMKSKQLIAELARASNGIFQLYPVGRLTVVGDSDRATVIKYGAQLREYGIDAVALTPDELKARFPGMNVADVGAALFTKDDGVLYPPALIWALAGAFRNADGIIWEGCGAQSLLMTDGRVKGVRLGNGDILESERIILAAGIWSRKFLQSAGLDLALKHQVTHNTVVSVGRVERWREVPSLLDGVQGLIAIPRNPGTIMAANTAGEYEAEEATADQVLKTTAVELIDQGGSFARETRTQTDQVERMLRHRYIDYDIRGVTGHWAGLLDGTPDNHPFLGPYPNVAGLWVGCGLTGYGVQRGPGVGETLANLALGRPLDVDVSLYRLDRFDARRNFKIDLSTDNPFEGFKRSAVA